MRITGVEALLRWHSAEYGDIPPDRFIPLAEESGLILEIGEWAMREACATLQRWRQHGLDDLTMAVNVSALQLLRGNLPDVVARALAKAASRRSAATGTDRKRDHGQRRAERRHAAGDPRLGVGLAIDDFGTGYSSLAYLKRLPIDTLKIDKEFIGDLTRDADDEAITSTVIAMAHSLGLTVVAEGVETEAQMQFLRDHGCDEIQGYWLAQPAGRATTAWPSCAAGPPAAAAEHRASPGCAPAERPARAVLDPLPARSLSSAMDRAELIAELQSLSARLDELAARARRLSEENRSLRSSRSNWSANARRCWPRTNRRARGSRR